MNDARALVCAQYMTPGNGGIAAVARLTARALGGTVATGALACMDESDFTLGGVGVRAFGGSRPRFVLAALAAAAGASHVVHDFPGTARMRRLMLAGRARHAVWAHGEEVWGRARPDYVAALERADLVLVTTVHSRERAATALRGCRAVAQCALGTEDDDPPAAIGPADGPPAVLLLGRIDAGFPKGHDVLLSLWPAVVSAVPGARLVFAGGGPALEALRARVRASPVAGAVTVTGPVPEAAIGALWRSATVFAMPSRGEGFGLVFIEAMRRGLPVIASTADAGQEINRHGETGFCLDRDRPDDIAGALVALLRDDGLCRRLGAAGHALWRAHYRRSCFEERFLAATAAFRAARPGPG